MDIFNGNSKLEEAIFTGMDYALWSRHDINSPFTPFMMLFKDGKRKLTRVVADGDPNAVFEKMLREDKETYDQVVMCLEGRVPVGNEKQDAIIVKGFDTSEATGLLFAQRFRGIESGAPFEKLGNIALYSKEEKLPVKLVPRKTNKEVEEPYISGMVVSTDDNMVRRIIIAGHDNASYLAPRLFDAVLNILDKKEDNFSGNFEIKFVPGTLKNDDLTQFILRQTHQQITTHRETLAWEKQFNRKVKVSFNFDENGKVAEAVKPASDKPADTTNKYSGLAEEELNEEFHRIVSIPNARTNITALTEMAALMKEYKTRGLELPGVGASRPKGKKWWEFWK
jgi:hypothetical protein